MTLITYLTRVHFADGVLEEALHGEMERNQKRRPLIIAERAALEGALADRFFAGFPKRTLAETYSTLPMRPTEEAAQEIAQAYRRGGCDLLIAFGGNRAIDLAKVARIAIAYDEPIAAFSDEEGGSQRISASLPDLYSVPGILGFASAVSDYARVRLNAGGQVMLSSRELIPTVTICDPTLTLGGSAEESACAAAGIVARSVEVYLSPRYNPPADGLALDSLIRVAPLVDRISDAGNLEVRRELMAAGLNSGLAMQKGLCLQHAIANALASASHSETNPIVLGPVLIPEIIPFYDDNSQVRTRLIRESLRLASECDLGEGLTSFFSNLPVATRLSQLKICEADLPVAADLAAGDRAIAIGPHRLTRPEVLSILQAVH